MFDEYGNPITSAMVTSDPTMLARSYYDDAISPFTGTKKLLSNTTSNTSFSPFKSAGYKQGWESGIRKSSDSVFGFDNIGDALKDEHFLGNMAGLASTLMQAVSLPSMLENAKLQNKSLKFNLDTAKQEQARRNKNIESFNNVNTSAFV